MTVPPLLQPHQARDRRPSAGSILRLLLAGLLGVAAALLVACSSSGKGLIPASAAGPLQNDFEAVQQTAESANGDCTATEAALQKTAADFAALPLAVDAGLRSNLGQGIANLRVRAHELCSQPSAQATTTGAAPTTSSTPTATSTPTTPPTSTETTPTSPSSPGGGTPAPGEEEPSEPAEGKGKGKGHDNGHGGTGSEEGAAGGIGAGGQEAGK
jgi:hypothetical protein